MDILAQSISQFNDFCERAQEEQRPLKLWII